MAARLEAGREKGQGEAGEGVSGPTTLLSVREVQRRKSKLDQDKFAIEKQHDDAIVAWRLRRKALETRCPHKNMGGGSYSRWCNDCGWSEDTT